MPAIARGLERLARAALLGLALASPLAAALDGRVVDRSNGRPVAGALVTVGRAVIAADAQGVFHIAVPSGPVGVRAPGYQRVAAAIPTSPGELLEVALTPFRPKALYLSFYGIGDRELRQAALDIAATTEINALVIDVKGDRGTIPYRSSIALADKIGATDITTVRDPAALLASLKARHLYLIARVVVFKDSLLATARPELAVRTAEGALWRDREDLAWVDPFRRETWDYAIAVAAEAAALGFDEIQFDYVRFPDAAGLVFSQPNTEAHRVAAIGGFLAAAREALAPYNVFVAADVFGYVCWNANDTAIGQRLEDLAGRLDYLSPMLYPSGFQYGIPGYRDPVAHPREIVAQTLARAAARTQLPGVRFRPWLQAFRDYAFDGRRFGPAEIRAQIEAAEAFGSDGWMLWNPRNSYGKEALKSESAPTPPTTEGQPQPPAAPGRSQSADSPSR